MDGQNWFVNSKKPIHGRAKRTNLRSGGKRKERREMKGCGGKSDSEFRRHHNTHYTYTTEPNKVGGAATN
jgi:hypothetical protein